MTVQNSMLHGRVRLNEHRKTEKEQINRRRSHGSSQMWCEHRTAEDVTKITRGKSWNPGEVYRQVWACVLHSHKWPASLAEGMCWERSDSLSGDRIRRALKTRLKISQHKQSKQIYSVFNHSSSRIRTVSTDDEFSNRMQNEKGKRLKTGKSGKKWERPGPGCYLGLEGMEEILSKVKSIGLSLASKGEW